MTGFGTIDSASAALPLGAFSCLGPRAPSQLEPWSVSIAYWIHDTLSAHTTLTAEGWEFLAHLRTLAETLRIQGNCELVPVSRFHRAALPLSCKTLNYAAGISRRHRKSIGSRWRKLNPGQQALLVLAHLRKGETFAGLAAGFAVGTTTAWRTCRRPSPCSRGGRRGVVAYLVMALALFADEDYRR